MSRGELSSWPGAFVLAAAFMGLVLSVRGPRDPVSLPAPDPVRLRFLPIAEGSPAAESRQIWLPALFPFPSELGFGRNDQGLALMRPPLAVPGPEPLYVGSPKTILAASETALEFDRTDPLADHFRSDFRPDAPVFPLSGAVRRMTCMAPWSPAAFDAMPWPEDANTRPAWEATAYIVFTEQGMPARVFVETATRPEVRPMVARALRAWRLADPVAPRRGRVRLRYEPDAPAEEG